VRFINGLSVGVPAVCVVCLAGCSSGSQPSIAGRAADSPRAVTSFAPPAAPASPRMRAGARAAAAQFYGLYSASQFAASWNLLGAGTKREVPEHIWVSVHDACPSAGARKPRTIKAVTVFGDAAIVTEAIAATGSKPDTTEDVFSYTDGHWSYSPVNPSIYQHGSVSADIAAAKAAGLCASWKVF
jgi:hypothetical protein